MSSSERPAALLRAILLAPAVGALVILIEFLINWIASPTYQPTGAGDAIWTLVFIFLVFFACLVPVAIFLAVAVGVFGRVSRTLIAQPSLATAITVAGGAFATVLLIWLLDAWLSEAVRSGEESIARSLSPYWYVYIALGGAAAGAIVARQIVPTLGRRRRSA